LRQRNANFTVNCHLISSIAVAAGSIRQLNIAPTLNTFTKAI